MEIRYNNKVCIFSPIDSILNEYKIKKIFEKLEKETVRNIAIDLSNVRNCPIEFIEALKKYDKRNISLFNIDSDIFVLFNILGVDKLARLYVSECDFEENSRQLINRKFSIV